MQSSGASGVYGGILLKPPKKTRVAVNNSGMNKCRSRKGGGKESVGPLKRTNEVTRPGTL